MMIVLMLALAQAGGASPIETIAEGRNSNVGEPKQAVVRTAAEWESLWKAHGAAQPLPDVDFSREMVAAIFLGTRPTGGHRVQIVDTRREGAALVVEYVERRPGRGDIVTQALTSPFHIVTLPRHDGDVRFSPSPTAR